MRNPEILIVEDEPDILKLIKIILSLNDYRFTEALTGEECLMRLKLGYIPEVIILDIVLPDMSGYDIIKFIKQNKEFKNTKILVVSANGLPGDIKRAMDLGVDGYIVKPFSPDSLIKKIEDIFSQRNKEIV